MGEAKYFFRHDDLDENRDEFFDETGAVTFLVRYNKEEGELFVKDISGIKLKFNTLTGAVTTVSSESTKGIRNYYSADAFYHVINPIADAISILAKFNLLLKLHELHDIEISNIIRTNHIEDAGFKNVDHVGIDKTFKQIRNTVKPTLFRRRKKTKIQRIIHNVLHKIQGESIKCKNDVEKILTKITEKMLQESPKKISHESKK